MAQGVELGEAGDEGAQRRLDLARDETAELGGVEAVERLGQDVRDVLLGAHKVHRNDAARDEAVQPVVANVDVLHSVVHSVGLGVLQRGLVVAVDRDRQRGRKPGAELGEQVVDVAELLGQKCLAHILGLHSRQALRGVVLAANRDQVVVHVDEVAGQGAARGSVSGPVGVSEGMDLDIGAVVVRRAREVERVVSVHL